MKAAFSLALLLFALPAIADEPVDLDRHHPAAEIKGATFTEIRVASKKGRWVAQCVVDV